MQRIFKIFDSYYTSHWFPLYQCQSTQSLPRTVGRALQIPQDSVWTWVYCLCPHFSHELLHDLGQVTSFICPPAPITRNRLIVLYSPELCIKTLSESSRRNVLVLLLMLWIYLSNMSLWTCASYEEPLWRLQDCLHMESGLLASGQKTGMNP